VLSLFRHCELWGFIYQRSLKLKKLDLPASLVRGNIHQRRFAIYGERRLYLLRPLYIYWIIPPPPSPGHIGQCYFEGKYEKREIKKEAIWKKKKRRGDNYI
jgi:hypothetical protein